MGIELYKHLTRQFNNRFAEDIPFQFLLFNIKQRHLTSLSVSLSIKSNMIPEVNFLLQSRHGKDKNLSFQEHMDNCLKNPEDPESVAFCDRINKVTKLCGSIVPFSDRDRKSVLAKNIALCQRYGLPNFFFTLSFSEIHSKFMIRIGT